VVHRIDPLTRPAGTLLFVGMMALGYYYNVTFVQIGLTDLGRTRLGLPPDAVATVMAVLALVTSLVAVVVGLWLRRIGGGRDLVQLLRLAAGVVVVQTVLTALTPLVATPAAYLAWVVVCSLALGVGVPSTFALTVHLVPVRRRGAAAAGVTALAYLAAPLGTGDWTVEHFTRQLLWVMAPGALAAVALAWSGSPLVRAWSLQHADPAFGAGRFTRSRGAGRAAPRRRLVAALVLMFGVFFVDSLGFLRLLETPVYMANAWHAAELGPRLAIALTHVVAALIGGVLYTSLGERHLLAWVFGVFALVHLMYGIDARMGGSGTALMTPLLYAVAVSLYTVVTFALWADLSTPDDVTVHAALGVATSAWTATFLSTALALRWEAAGVSLRDHLASVEAIALLAFAALLIVAVAPRRRVAA
jgi:MFS family permease